MTTTLVLRFPRERYHATPWDWPDGDPRVETPPSPWRLLRALYATWRTRVAELDEVAVHTLLGALAVPPRFFVSQHRIERRSASAGQDESYAAERETELAVEWPGALLLEERATLTRLASAMPYLGRAESPCTGSVPSSWTPRGHERWEPLDVADRVTVGAVVTSVLAPVLPLDVAALLARPLDVRRSGLTFPLGTRLLAYQRCPTPEPSAGPVTAVRLSVVDGPFPPATSTLFVTDLLRRAALSHLEKHRPERMQTLLGGKSADARTFRDQHAHTHYLPLIEDEQVTAVAAWTPGELPADEVTAFTAIKRLSSNRRAAPRLTVRATATGTSTRVVPELAATAVTWTSSTPYTAARFPKRHDDRLAFLAEDVARELDYRSLPASAKVEIVDRDVQAWCRYRPSAGPGSPQRHASKPSAFLRLHFDEPVTGPLALGHLSHFGLGLFVPEG